MTDALKSEGMTPKVFEPMWKCRHCGHKWPIADPDNLPRQCPNRKCRAMDWHRPKYKIGRPKAKPVRAKKGRK